MAIYLGTNKLTGTGVQVDDAINSSSTNPVQNKVVAEALSDVGYSEWQKPSDWIDIRSGALNNSIYFLVGHSADYTKYPDFNFTATISTGANTYDVYIDGIKKFTTNSGTETAINWQTLSLTSGFDTTHPEELVTHIVRITPTVSTDTITRLQMTIAKEKGLLWTHFAITNAINLDRSFQNDSSSTTTNNCPFLEAVTATDNQIKVNGAIRGMFQFATGLIEVATLVSTSNSAVSALKSFNGCTSLRHIKFENFTFSDCDYMFQDCNALQKIESTGDIILGRATLDDANALKQLPNVTFNTTYGVIGALYRNTVLQPTFLDASGASTLPRLTVSGTATARVDGLKGLVVSNLAPFTGSSPQLNVSYTGLDRGALVNLFNSLPTVTGGQVCNVTGATGASDLTAEDIAIVTQKGWTLTR